MRPLTVKRLLIRLVLSPLQRFVGVLLACGGGRGGLHPSTRLMEMCCWMGSHFCDWVDCKGVAFSIELLEWGRTFCGYWGSENPDR